MINGAIGEGFLMLVYQKKEDYIHARIFELIFIEIHSK